jgi:DNA-binding CsgD family transcriptional regulator/tetratricopeptide (TPR) repeat protein
VPGRLRGRGPEMAQLIGVLQETLSGTGSAAFVEGEAGAGKTRLLDELIAQARRQRVTVARANADEIDSMAPLSTLLRAVAEADPAILAADEVAALRRQANAGPSVVRDVQSVLERVAGRAPVLIAIDDVDTADDLTVAAVRLLLRQLSSSPVAWVLTSRLSSTARVARLRAAVTEAGGPLITLSAVDEETIAQIVQDVVGAPPDEALVRLAAASGGNLFLLTEMIQGALAEGAIAVAGTATVTTGSVPRRLDEAVRARLAVLSADARHLLDVAAVIGRSFRLEDVLALVDRSAVQALPSVRELLDAGVVAESGDAFLFRHDLTRRAVLDWLPPQLVGLLHRDVAWRLLDAGAPPVDVARHLLAGTATGDDRAVRVLVDAAERLIATAPQQSAELYRKALEVTASDLPRWLDLVVPAGRALIAAGGLAEAHQLFESAVANGLAPAAEAMLRVEISEARWLRGQPTEAVDVLQPVVDRADLAATVRARINLSLARALALSGQPGAALTRLDDGIRIARQFDDRSSLVFGLAVKSYALRFAGNFTESLQVAGEAVQVARDGPVARLPDPRIYLARSLIAMDRLSEAEDVCRALMRDVQVTSDATSLPGAHVTYAWLLLASGRVPDAVTEVEAGLAALELSQGNPLAADLFGCAAAALWLAGDEIATREVLQRSADQLQDGAFEVGPMGPLVDAVPLARALVEQPEDAAKALDVAAPLIDRIGESFGQLVFDPSHGPALVRVALGCQDLQRARHVAAATQRLGVLNPGVACWQASARQASALLDGDFPAAASAAETFAACGRPLAAAMARADAARLLIAHGDPGAAEMRDTAVAEFVAVGADGAATRLGKVSISPPRTGQPARPRRRPATRPKFGWDSLTAAELRVVALAARGATNKEIAERLWLSPYTVDTHLRHSFAKLGLRSRVALARVVAERGPTASLEISEA